MVSCFILEIIVVKMSMKYNVYYLLNDILDIYLIVVLYDI